MPWPCVLYESYEAAAEAGGGTPRVGAMYPAEYALDYRPGGEPLLSAKYFRDVAPLRPPLEVQLPCGPFLIDSRAMRNGVPYGEGWNPVGEPPRVTLSPSISIPGRHGYHGYIRHGVITDDCEVRTFPASAA